MTKKVENTGRPSKFPYEFKRMIAEKAISGQHTFRELALQYQVSQGAINVWKRQYLNGELENTNPVKMEKPSEAISKVIKLERENKNLKEELGDLYLQNTILKKAAAFSQQLRKETSSIVTAADLKAYEKDVE